MRSLTEEVIYTLSEERLLWEKAPQSINTFMVTRLMRKGVSHHFPGWQDQEPCPKVKKEKVS